MTQEQKISHDRKEWENVYLRLRVLAMKQYQKDQNPDWLVRIEKLDKDHEILLANIDKMYTDVL